MTRMQNDEIISVVIAELAVWTGLPADQIGADADMLALGLQSVEAVLLCGAVEQHFGITIDPVLIFQSDTVADFAALIAAAIAAAPEKP
jgi:acyl carrier protein